MIVIVHVIRDVFKSAQFAELSEESLAFILASDRLQAEEAEIFEAVKEWGTVNMVINQSSLKESLQQASVSPTRVALTLAFTLALARFLPQPLARSGVHHTFAQSHTLAAFVGRSCLALLPVCHHFPP